MYEEKEIKFGNTSINWSDFGKYLGKTIDPKFNLISYIKTVISKSIRVKFFLHPLINHLSLLPLWSKLYIYETYIRSIILCGTCLVWKYIWFRLDKTGNITVIYSKINVEKWFVCIKPYNQNFIQYSLNQRNIIEKHKTINSKNRKFKLQLHFQHNKNNQSQGIIIQKTFKINIITHKSWKLKHG